MKKVQLDTSKLQLIKDRIGSLSKEEMSTLNGGTGLSPCMGTYDNCGPNTGTIIVTNCGGCGAPTGPTACVCPTATCPSHAGCQC